MSSHGHQLGPMEVPRSSLSRQSLSSSYGKTTPSPVPGGAAGAGAGAPMILEAVMSKIEKAELLDPNILPNSDKSGDDYWMGDMYDPLIKREIWKLDDEKSCPYLAHLRSISLGWPHIRWLTDFYEVSTSPGKWKFLTPAHISSRAARCRVALLSFSSPASPPTRRDIHSSAKLTALLRDFEDPSEGNAKIFIVEDLSRDVIEAFGSTFDIDPEFFAGHINDYLWFNTADPWAELPSLPHLQTSGVRKGWWNFRYMRPRFFRSQNELQEAVEQMGGWNVLRRLEQELSYRVRKLRENDEAPVGVLRTKASLWIRSNKEGETGIVAILVVDPTPVAGHPLWNGPRTLHPCPSMRSHASRPPTTPPPRTSHFEDIIHYTSTLTPTLTCTISLANLAYPFLSLMAAEWLTVLQYITTSLIRLEYALEHPSYRSTTSSLDFALDRLHPLRRLIPVYRCMLAETLNSFLSQDPPNPETLDLHVTYSGLLTTLDTLSSRASAIISLATALISVEENKRAMKMNTNLVRVTYLAVVFVPMAFVSSFFSMTPDLSSITTTIWIYFSVAVPLTALCLAIADPRRVRRVFWWCIGKSTHSPEYLTRGIRTLHRGVL